MTELVNTLKIEFAINFLTYNLALILTKIS